MFCICILFACPATIRADDISTRLIPAFQNGNTALLQPHIPADHRIQMGISSVGIPNGNYSSAQALALLQQAFRQHKTVSFSLKKQVNAVRCEWRVRNIQSGMESLIILYISYQQQDDKQIITSIRGS